MFYVLETSEGRVFVVSSARLESTKDELSSLGEEFDLYFADDIQIVGSKLSVKYYGKKIELE
jgi:hypothetical protein